MMKRKKSSPFQSFNIVANVKGVFLHHNHGWGLGVLFMALLALSVLASWRSTPSVSLYLAGEIAGSDVVAPRDMLVEDLAATQLRRDQAMTRQPLIFNLDKESISRFRTDTLSLMHALNSRGDADIASVADKFNEEYGTSLPEEDFKIMAQPEVQEYVLNNVVPWLEVFLNEGVVPDMRQLSSVQNSLIVRDVDSGTEVIRSQAGGLHDQRSMLVALGQKLRADSDILAQEKAAVLDIMSLLLLPTLALNQDATNQRNSEVLRAVEPVFYQVQRGEMVVRSGDKVSHEQQIVIQSLYKRGESSIDIRFAAGTLMLSMVISLGLFMTPSGIKGTVLQTRDQVFIAMLLLGFGLAAWAYARILLPMSGPHTTATLVFSFPVAAGAGLAALIFSAKRYCTVGVLLAFFSAAMLRTDLPAFLFFFLSAMFNTWLVLKAQSRQDVVWSTLPLFGWLLATGLAAVWMNHLPVSQLPVLVLALSVNALLSITLVFAFSPILEMSMGFTTRFRLMELMNLEQPLLQHMMMTTPGTYHHSLLVSYLVEAGAAAVGANSLLCRISALYHDIGKLPRPDYFVENQFGGENPHDKLAPSMSALILCAHVKQGMELADEYKLGREIKDIIAQHHGTRCISYFYQRAVALGENPRLADYCYMGPKPQSIEAAIVMIADSVEASSRTLIDPTPARIKAHVEKIIKGIYAEGQLDDSELTLHDLNKLSESFIRTLIGLFHKRINYPDNGPGRPGSNPAGRPSKPESGASAAVAGRQAETGKLNLSRASGSAGTAAR